MSFANCEESMADCGACRLLQVTPMQSLPSTLAIAHSTHLVVFILACQVLTIVCYWLASLLLARRMATLKNAVITYVKVTLTALLIGAVGAFCIYASVGIGAHPVIPGILVFVTLFSFIVIFVAVPKREYALGLGRAIVFVIVQAALGAAASYAMKPLRPVVKLPAFLQRLEVDEGAERPLPAAEVAAAAVLSRREDLRKRGEQLAIRKQKLSPKDAVAISQYDRDKAAYDRDLSAHKLVEAAVAADLSK
jgi:hypothetical protein